MPRAGGHEQDVALADLPHAVELHARLAAGVEGERRARVRGGSLRLARRSRGVHPALDGDGTEVHATIVAGGSRSEEAKIAGSVRNCTRVP
jgi:hypothetical protein